MAFEIAHPQLQFGSLSRVRRILAALLGLVLLAGLVWSCVTAYNARPLDGPALKKPIVTPGVGPRAT
ncbi:hypothetical protein [Rhodoblastus sp.]|uniref:hypothetical protein n=1 Tax=Rhodoblastus sp. TaxID=1962975 RepID=UPI0035B41E05